jgi:hypothetical protein
MCVSIGKLCFEFIQEEQIRKQVKQEINKLYWIRRKDLLLVTKKHTFRTEVFKDIKIVNLIATFI